MRKKTTSLWGLLYQFPEEIPSGYELVVNYFYWLKLLALTVFKWNNLPETVNERFLEETLFNKGKILFFNDTSLGFLVLPCNAESDLNIYGEPIKWRVNTHKYNASIPAVNSVLIRNNDLEIGSINQVVAFSQRLAETEKTIDINVKAQKTPVLILTDDKQKLTMTNAYKQYADGAPVIFADKNLLNADAIKVLRTDAPFIVDKLDTHKMNLWNEALTFLGIQNANTDKRERLIVDEVNANNQHVAQSVNIMLKAREKAVEEINSLFGLNVSVELRETIQNETPIFNYQPKEQDEGENE